jgi:hypothetical protein
LRRLSPRQPWKAVTDKDYAWLSAVIAKHYRGDDSDLKLMAAGLLQAYGDFTIEEYATAVKAFFETAQNPKLGRPYTKCVYQPMVELLRYLSAHGFTSYIVSGGFGYSLDETFDVGCDKGAPVTDEYPTLASFTGKIIKIDIDLKPDLAIDVLQHSAEKMKAALLRQ